MTHYVLISCLIFAFTNFVLVTADCQETIANIPRQIRIREDERAIKFTVPYNSSDTWSFDVIKLNGGASNLMRRNLVKTYFDLVLNNDTGRLLLNVTKDIDLEYLKEIVEMDISSIDLEIRCGPQDKIEIKVVVDAVNEFPPVFVEMPYSISMEENTAIGTSIFNVKSNVIDKDVRSNGAFNYYIEPYRHKTSLDGSGYFGIPYTSLGIVKVNHVVDYDDMRSKGQPLLFVLNLTAEGFGPLKSWTTLNITIVDTDDQNPVFSACVPPCRAQYSVNTQANYRGVLEVHPPFSAADPDSFNNSIKYKLELVSNRFSNAFEVDENTGQLRQIKNVLSTGVLSIKATENSLKQHSSIATVLVTLGNDTTIPTPEATVVKEESNTLLIAIIILAVIAIIIIVVIIIVFCVYHKKTAKAVSPKDDGSADISHSQNWPGMNTGSKAELLASDLLNPAYMATLQGRGNTLPPLTKDSATGTGKKRSRRRNRNKEPEIFDGTREYEGKLDLEFFTDANTKSKIKQSTRSRDTKTDPKYWITIPNDDD